MSRRNPFVAPANDHRVINPSTGNKLLDIPEGMPADVDLAVEAARKAYKTTWGTKIEGFKRGEFLIRIAELIERDIDIISSLEALDNGKTFSVAKGFDVGQLRLRTKVL